MIDLKKLKSMHKTAKNQVSETTNLLNAVKLKIVTQAKTYLFDGFSKKKERIKTANISNEIALKL